jgi:predicted amidohydrolase
MTRRISDKNHMSKRPIKIATAQSYISADVRENGREVRRLMRQAREEGAALVHFSEGAMSGYTKSQIKSWDHVEWEALVHELQLVASLAGDLGLWAVVGSNHRLTAPHRPHNSLYVISAQGKLVTRYDKQFCSNTEISNWYTPGREYCVFEVDGWRFGCALCIEIQFPELFLKYTALDVDCILFSSYSESSMFGTQAQGYAASHSYWISVSVPAQTSHALSSRLIAPSGEIQVEAAPSISTVVLGQLDADSPDWRIPLHHAKPWRAKAREGAIYRQWYVQDPRSDEKSTF